MSEMWELGRQIKLFNGSLKKARLMKGLNQTEVADKVGITCSAYSHYENLRSVPSEKVAKRIADVLGVKMEQIFPLEFLKMMKDEDVESVQYGKVELRVLNNYVAGQTLLLEERLDPELALAKKLCYGKLNKLIDEKLSPRQKKIVEMYYGLNGYERHTLEEVAEVFGCTRESIRQSKVFALERLKKSPELRGLAKGLFEKE